MRQRFIKPPAADGNGTFLQYGTLPSRLKSTQQQFGSEEVCLPPCTGTAPARSHSSHIAQEPRPDMQLAFASKSGEDMRALQPSTRSVAGLKAAEKGARSAAALRARNAVATLAALDAPGPLLTPIGSMYSACPRTP